MDETSRRNWTHILPWNHNLAFMKNVSRINIKSHIKYYSVWIQWVKCLIAKQPHSAINTTTPRDFYLTSSTPYLHCYKKINDDISRRSSGCHQLANFPNCILKVATMFHVQDISSFLLICTLWAIHAMNLKTYSPYQIWWLSSETNYQRKVAYYQPQLATINLCRCNLIWCEAGY